MEGREGRDWGIDLLSEAGFSYSKVVEYAKTPAGEVTGEHLFSFKHNGPSFETCREKCLGRQEFCCCSLYDGEKVKDREDCFEFFSLTIFVMAWHVF